MVADAIGPTTACRILKQDKPVVFFAHNGDFDRQFFGGCSFSFAHTK